MFKGDTRCVQARFGVIYRTGLTYNDDLHLLVQGVTHVFKGDTKCVQDRLWGDLSGGTDLKDHLHLPVEGGNACLKGTPGEEAHHGSYHRNITHRSCVLFGGGLWSGLIIN